MDTRPLTDSDSITVDMVNKSPTKKLVVLSGGAMVNDREGKSKFQCLVEMDGKQKLWRPNKTTIRNLQAKHGYDSQNWVGKAVVLSIGTVEGKTAIIGTCE